MSYNNTNKDSYNTNLVKIDAGNHEAINNTQNNNELDNDIILNNGDRLISQRNDSNLKASLITDDITIISKGGINGNTDYGNNSLNNRLELLNNSVSLRKNDNTDTSTFAKSFQANEITPGSIKIKNKAGNELVCIDTNDNTNGTIEIRDNGGKLLFKISEHGMVLNVPTNIGANSFMSSTNFSFNTNKADKFKVANRNYIDKRYRLDNENEYWRTVSTKLFTLNNNVSFPAKIKEFVKINKAPIRYEYEVREDSKIEYSKNENTGNQVKTVIKYKKPIVKTYTGSNFIIGTNLCWSFAFTRARRETKKRPDGTIEYKYDDEGKYSYLRYDDGNLKTDKITI